MARLFTAIALILLGKSEAADGMVPLDLSDTPGMDRDLEGVTVDLAYKLRVPDDWWRGAKADATYAEVMKKFHGENIWESDVLMGHLRNLDITTNGSGLKSELDGSALDEKTILQPLMSRLRPRVVLEVGVFRGSTSTAMAKLLDVLELHDSFVVSMDTWLLDLRFVWGADSSVHKNEIQQSRYFRNKEVAGSSQMYFTFLANVLQSNTSHRIIPVQTASSNGAMALIAHKIRPDLIYVDASHSNPDVFLDFINFWGVLSPGGALAVDDLQVPAVKSAFDAFCRLHGLSPVVQKKRGVVNIQGYVLKPADWNRATGVTGEGRTAALAAKKKALVSRMQRKSHAVGIQAAGRNNAGNRPLPKSKRRLPG